MSVIVVQKRKPTAGAGFYTVPEGGEILWFGVAADLPSGWQIVTAASGKFVMGAAMGGASDTPAGANSHTHSYSSVTGSAGGHTHTAYAGSLTASTTDIDHSPIANENVAVDGHTHTGTGTPFTTSSAGSHTHSLVDTGEATIYPLYRRLYWIKATMDVECPVNGIVVWNGNQGNKPGGFAVCNGSNGTPDMRDRFVYVANEDGDIDAAGGSESHSHTNSSTQTGGSHTHSISVYVLNDSGYEKKASNYGGTGLMAKPHNHTASGNLPTQASHSHSFGDTNVSNHLPKYMYLYYIMRTA